MFRKDIENIYTDTVKEYFDKGYRIYYSTMGGHQGEIAKIDLTNGKEIIRILLTNKTEIYKKENSIFGHMLLEYFTIIVGKNTDKLWGDSFSDIIWNEHLELISEIRFYKIGRKNNYFFGTKQEAIDAQIMMYKRFNMRNYCNHEEIILPDKAKSIVLPFVKRQRKCKSATVNQIEQVKKVISYNKDKIVDVTYYIKVKGQLFEMK